jgi:hypothetical protein
MIRSRRHISGCLALLGSALLAGVSLAAGFVTPEIRTKLNAATAASPAIPAQADTLARIAWPDEGVTDPPLAAAARYELERFGQHAIEPLRAALHRVPPRFQADVLATMIAARESVTLGIPPGFISALDEALWFGTVDAQRQAMIELARFGFPLTTTAAVDAVHMHPELLGVVIAALGMQEDDRSRFFLSEVLQADPEYRRPAASALADVGGQALDILRQATRHPDRAVREVAVDALLPRAGIDDLTVLHEYVGSNAGDDPAVLGRVRERATFLENLLEQQGLVEQNP